MNMPLNIDFQQVLLHLLNFVILAGGLYLLLYKPVKKFMEARQAHFADLEAKAAETQNEAEAAKAAYESRLAEAEAEISRKKAEAAKLSAEAAAQELDKAKAKADEILRESRKNAEAEKRQIVDGARAELVQLAVDAARKIVMDPDEAYQSFAQAVSAENHDGT